MNLRPYLIVIVWLVAHSLSGAEPQAQSPCKSPKDLLSAVKKALEAQDTNAFWYLHIWTNVPARDERLHKSEARNAYFKSSDPGETISYSAFSIRNAPTNTMATMGFAHNIPTTGVIQFKTRKVIPTQFSGSPIKMTSEHGCLFGKGPDGNYWLAVGVLPLKTNRAAQSHQ